MSANQIILGDALDVLKKYPDNHFDSIVTDPPYGLAFMGKKWDYDVPSEEIWKECLRVLKPGGHLLAFAGTRTQHRMAVRIEDAGFEIRDMIAWVYSTGFPKSLNIEKAINKIDGVEFDEVPASGVGFMNAEGEGGYNVTKNQLIQKGDSSERALQWEGWGTALKPALEPITLARKPLDGNVANNCLKWGVGGINVDGCRVGYEDGGNASSNPLYRKQNGYATKHGADKSPSNYGLKSESGEMNINSLGRFPANLIHDGSDEVVELFPTSNSGNGKASDYEKHGGQWGAGKQIRNADYGDSGSAARFFYVPKASKKDRDEGLDGFQLKAAGGMSGRQDGSMGSITMSRNVHPTVKPTKLMRYLCRLITPKGGHVLDPFAGSGSTGKAAVLEGFQFTGIEREQEYVDIAIARINNVL